MARDAVIESLLTEPAAASSDAEMPAMDDMGAESMGPKGDPELERLVQKVFPEIDPAMIGERAGALKELVAYCMENPDEYSEVEAEEVEDDIELDEEDDDDVDL